MLERADALTREYDLLPPGTAVLCAVSGGADSMCLLHWLRGRGDLVLHAAHFDHALRGEESRADAAFVRETCESWGIPFHLGSADVAGEAKRRGTGIEETARRLRYAFLEAAAEAVGASTVATAHTAGDNAETVLLNLTRGTGLRGLCGIPPLRVSGAGETRFVRPLLTTTRAEILAYLEANGVPHREDATNSDETYARNRLRRRVTPVLEEVNPRAVDHISETALRLRELDAWLEEETARRLTAAKVEGDRASLPLSALTGAPAPVRPRMVQGLLDLLGAGRKDFGTVHLRAVPDLKPGGHLDLPSGVTAEARKGYLVLEKGNNHSQERKRRK